MKVKEVDVEYQKVLDACIDGIRIGERKNNFLLVKSKLLDDENEYRDVTNISKFSYLQKG